MIPRTVLRTAALNALATAASLSPPDPEFAPLIGAKVQLGATWPTQSPTPGAGPLPNQLLIYGWDENSDTVAEKTTAPQFDTTLTLVIEARVEVTALAASSVLPAQPDTAAITNAIDGALDALCFAVKKAICQGIGAASLALNTDNPGEALVETIKSVKIANKYDSSGQRIIGNGGIAFELLFGETFEPLIPNALQSLVILTAAEAGGVAAEGNAGNGTISAVAVGLGAQLGAYLVRFTSATAFAVTAPDDSSAGTGTVGATFSGGGLTFAIAAGTVPFVAGDGFTVTVQVISETQLDLS